MNIELHITRNTITFKHALCTIAAIVSVTLYSVPFLLAQDLSDSSWPMYGGNSAHTGRYNGPVAHTQGTVKWKIDIDACYKSSPAIGPDGTLYIGSIKGGLKAYDPEGKFIWEFPTGSSVVSSPALNSDGTIFFGSHDTYFYAVNNDGTLKWKFKTGDWIESSPAIANNGTIYFGSDDCALYAINPDGKFQWKYVTGGNIHSSPAIAVDGTIYFASGDSLFYALNPDGTLKWKLENIISEISSPSLGDDGTIYVRSGWGKITALNPDGTRKWAHDLDLGHTLLLTQSIGQDGTIYIGSYGNFFAVNPDGTIKWKYPIAEIRTNPVIGSDGIIYVAGYMEGGEYLIAFNSTGEIKWKYLINEGYTYYDCWAPKCPMYIFSSPVIGLDGTIYITTEDDHLFAFGPSVITSIDKADTQHPFGCLQNRPNPFNPNTTIQYIIPTNINGYVSLKVFDLRGALVKTLIDQVAEPGVHSVIWDGTTESGDKVSSGMYIYRLHAGDFTQSNKMLLVR